MVRRDQLARLGPCGGRPSSPLSKALYEVADGIYQVRGFDTSNMTMVESRSPPAAGPAKPQPNAASDARQVETPVARSLVADDVHDCAVIKVGLANGELPISYDKPA